MYQHTMLPKISHKTPEDALECLSDPLKYFNIKTGVVVSSKVFFNSFNKWQTDFQIDYNEKTI